MSTLHEGAVRAHMCVHVRVCLIRLRNWTWDILDPNPTETEPDCPRDAGAKLRLGYLTLLITSILTIHKITSSKSLLIFMSFFFSLSKILAVMKQREFNVQNPPLFWIAVRKLKCQVVGNWLEVVACGHNTTNCFELSGTVVRVGSI